MPTCPSTPSAAERISPGGVWKQIYASLDALQMDLDAWLTAYNERRPDQDRWCYGKTPMQTFVDSIPKEKLLAA